MCAYFTLKVFIVERCDIFIFALLFSVFGQPSFEAIEMNKTVSITVARVEEGVLGIAITLQANSASLFLTPSLFGRHFHSGRFIKLHLVLLHSIDLVMVAVLVSDYKLCLSKPNNVINL